MSLICPWKNCYIINKALVFIVNKHINTLLTEVYDTFSGKIVIWDILDIVALGQTWDVILVSLLLTLNRLHTMFWYFHCWFWTSKWRLGNWTYELNEHICTNVIQKLEKSQIKVIWNEDIFHKLLTLLKATQKN